MNQYRVSAWNRGHTENPDTTHQGRPLSVAEHMSRPLENGMHIAFGGAGDALGKHFAQPVLQGDGVARAQRAGQGAVRFGQVGQGARFVESALDRPVIRLTHAEIMPFARGHR